MGSKNGQYSREWERDIRRMSKQLDVELGIVFQKIALQVLEDVANGTPRDTGLAAASWMTSIDIPDETVNDSVSRDSLEEGAPVIEGAAIGETIIISNNLQYIEFLDGGSSTQAPNGFVAQALARADAVFELENDIE